MQPLAISHHRTPWEPHSPVGPVSDGSAHTSLHPAGGTHSHSTGARRPGRGPELEAALALAHQFKEAAPDAPVIFTVHELQRLGRFTAELMSLSAELQAGRIQLELLTGPFTGIYDPNGMGAMFFAVLAFAGQIERNYIREKTLKGQVTAAKKGNHGGRPKVVDDDMLTFALALKDKGVPVPDIAKKLTIKTGKNAGTSPSVASLYRAFAEAEQETTA
ncbi:recombinase family protein [Streptomyces sp. 6-11-2]|uniref:recombinase family protein n=1 Tax=Streptomyces sp. 6-11-2 TaxID=2585753 RepID=UPI00116ACA80|nr:recombinase family protein [Streptomyces sp. 6-11-2]GED88623.1 hypothetical protein TNCT6_57080 [Streptomyces sp. 6-11-2]